MKRKHGDGGVYRRARSRFYWITYTVNGRKIWESSHSEKESEARKLLRKRLGEVASGLLNSVDAERVTVSELAADVVSDYRANGKDTLDKAIRSAARVKEFFGNAKAHSVNGALVNKFRDKRLAEGAAKATVNRELSFLKRCFNLGIKVGKITRKPYIGMLAEDNVRSGFFSFSEFAAVRSASPEYFKPVVTFAYYTGWRKEEILSLVWDKIDLHSKQIRLDVGETKNGDGRVIPIDGELLEALEQQWSKRKIATVPGHAPALLSRYVFHRAGKKIGGKRGDIRDVWQKVCVGTKALNDKGEEVVLGQMVEVARRGKMVKKYVGKLFHDFRRTGSRDMVRAGIHELVVMQFTGHKTRSVFDRYNISSINDLEEAAKKRTAYAELQEERARKIVSLNRAERG